MFAFFAFTQSPLVLAMFDSIRSHRRWLMFFMLVLIFPSFVFFGIQGYNSMAEQSGALATVDGVPITQQEYDAALRDRTERVRQSLGANFDPKLLDTPEARAAILDQLVLDRALTKEATQSNLVVTAGSSARVHRVGSDVSAGRQVQLRAVQGLCGVARAERGGF